jgi:hypothetical protein
MPGWRKHSVITEKEIEIILNYNPERWQTDFLEPQESRF